MVTGYVCMCSCLPLCVSLCVCVYVCLWVYLCVIKSTDMFSIVVRSSVCSSLFLHMCCKQDTEEPQGTGDPSPYRKSLLPIRRPAHMLI